MANHDREMSQITGADNPTNWDKFDKFVDSTIPEDVSAVCVWGEHDYCTDTDIHPVAPGKFEAVYCECDCHNFNPIFIPSVDDETETLLAALEGMLNA
jgi:hypothetical protein